MGASIAWGQAKGLGLIALCFIGCVLPTSGYAYSMLSGMFDRNGRTFENIAVLGTSGWTCTFHRDGRLLATVVLPLVNDRRVALEGPDIDLTDSHADITVVCWQRGQMPVAKVISYGPLYAIVDFMPCFLPPEASDAERRFCATLPTVAYDRWMGYPSVVRMPPFDKPHTPP